MGSRRAQQCLRPDYARSEPGQRTALPQVRPAARRDENDGQRRQVLSSGVCEALVNLPMSFASFCEEAERERKLFAIPERSLLTLMPPHRIRCGQVLREGKMVSIRSRAGK